MFVFLVVHTQYTDHFGSINKSASTEVWGQYGDYIGGLLNPILSIFNICLLIYLSVNVATNEERRTKEAREYEEKRSREAIETQKLIALNAFRHEALNKLRDRLDSFEEFPDTFSDMLRDYTHLSDYISNFDLHYGYLFGTDDFGRTIVDLEGTLSSIVISIIPFSKRDEEPVIFLNSDSDTSDFDTHYTRYTELRYDLILIMQLIILDKPYNNVSEDFNN
jgi:hypothetical protein